MEKNIDTGIDEATKMKVINLIHALIPKCKIYLFGSRARGTYGHASDVDLAIDTGVQIERLRDVGEVQEVLNALYTRYKFEVVDFNNITTGMRNIILLEGLLWSNR